MTKRALHASRGVLGVCAAFVACIALALCLAPAAQAQDEVTRTIGAVNYTLPADWEGGSVSGEQTAELLGTDDVCQTDLYFKEDGLFMAMAIEDDEVSSLTIDDLEILADIASSGEVDSSLALMDSLGFDTSVDVEQGFPTLSVYTEKIELNGVTYGLTGKLFVVNDAQFKGGVFIMLLMPASGKLTENFLDSFPVLDEPQDIVIADAVMTVPEGYNLVEGSLFDMRFALAGDVDDLAGMLAVEIPFPTYDGTIGFDELQEAVDTAMDDYGQTEGVDFWMGVVDLYGFPSLAIDMILTDGVELDGVEELYIGALGSIMSSGTALIAFVEPHGYGFVDAILDSMDSDAMDGPVATGSANGAAAVDEPAAGEPKSSKGFVVTVL